MLRADDKQQIRSRSGEAERLGENFISALATLDFARLQECFAPEVRFRALIPRDLREGTGSEEATGYLRKWFGDSEQVELQASRAEMVSDRLHIAYRIREYEAGEWYLVEQQAYCVVAEGLIADMALLCSGFRPAPD